MLKLFAGRARILILNTVTCNIDYGGKSRKSDTLAEFLHSPVMCDVGASINVFCRSTGLLRSGNNLDRQLNTLLFSPLCVCKITNELLFLCCANANEEGLGRQIICHS